MKAESVKLTPMMEQWYQAKNQHPDAILLFRMGDFYELFGDDAILAAPILELALTSRDKDKSGLKMAGFPFHAAENYIAKLVERGHKIAICDQLEDAKLKKGIVKRGITNVVTPGTALDSESAIKSEQSFLVGIKSLNDDFAICALDLVTATFVVCSSKNQAKIIDEAIRYLPKELIILKNDLGSETIAKKATLGLKNHHVPRIERKDQLLRKNLNNFLADGAKSVVENEAIALVLSYVLELKGSVPSHIDSPKRYSIDEQLLMDDATRGNLDLYPKKKGSEHNLFSVLDETKTAMGKRALFQALSAPSTLKSQIEERLLAVEELSDDAPLRADIRDAFMGFYDLEKLTALAASNRISPRGLARLRDCLFSLDAIKKVVSPDVMAISKLLNQVPDTSKLHQKLVSSLAKDPPMNLKDGGVFCDGFDQELDEQRQLLTNAQELILKLESSEREESGIPSLKIRYTRVFGYYIEVTKTHLDKVPAHYQRKQTIANGERYVTKSLSDLEVKINNAESRTFEIEEQKFDELKKAVADEAPLIMQAGKIMGRLDMLASLAEIASVNSWVKPTLLEASDRFLEIDGGRHPIIEPICLKSGNYFVPNDTRLSQNDCRLMLISGPNMAGKSTIMRQAALIQILAQMGSFVPATKATLSICDAIFARVGASDDLATGRSTFMVEMSETAAILHNATPHSLILLDEIGRGTSTYDGVSIAQAVVEHIVLKLSSRCMFATHYHELTALEGELSGMNNFHVEIEDSGKDIRFLYTLAKGACLKSFGIEVARLSGLPKSVLNRASEVLRNLEAKKRQSVKTVNKPPQLSLFG